MEEIQKWILIGVEIILIVVTILHLRAENKKRKINIHKSKPYHPTSLAIILTLLFVSSFILLILLNRNPRVFQLIWDNWSIISRGVITTIAVSLLAILIGSAIGVLISLLLTLPKRKVFLSLIDSTLLSFIYILLGIPALVLLFLCYYGFNLSVFWASVIALSINLSPFVTKIVTSSISNISQEQIDSATSFGYNPWQIFWHFKFMFVLKNASQSLLVEYYTTIKLSSLAGLIWLYETYHATMDIITNTYYTINAYLILAICYVLIVTWIAVLADYLERRWKPIIN